MKEKIDLIKDESVFNIKEMIKELDISGEKINRFKWLSLFKGIILFIIAILYIKNPLGTNKTLVVFLGISVISSGVAKIINYFTSEKIVTSGRIISGIFDIFFGALIIYNIEISFVTLTILVSMWILAKGITQIGISFDLKKRNVKRWWLVLIGGIAGIILGIILFGNFGLSAFYITVYNTIYLMYSGILSIILFFDINNIQKRISDI